MIVTAVSLDMCPTIPSNCPIDNHNHCRSLGDPRFTINIDVSAKAALARKTANPTLRQWLARSGALANNERAFWRRTSNTSGDTPGPWLAAAKRSRTATSAP